MPPMSEEPINKSDEQIELLKEIRDLLIQSNKQGDQMQADYMEKWEAQLRDNRQTKIGCFSSLAAMIAILLLMLLYNAVL